VVSISRQSVCRLPGRTHCGGQRVQKQVAAVVSDLIARLEKADAKARVTWEADQVAVGLSPHASAGPVTSGDDLRHCASSRPLTAPGVSTTTG
jgi:hypothetical protein